MTAESPFISHFTLAVSRSSQFKVIKIERSEIPEEYRTVAVSHDVVNQILNLRNAENDTDTVRDLR